MVKETTDFAVLILEFEEILGIAILFLLLLIYLFYVKYPLDKEVNVRLNL